MISKPILALAVFGGLLAQSAAQLSERVGDWPQWRGLHRDGVSRETDLLAAWPDDGPTLRWTLRDVGIGYGGPALVGERLYLLGDLPGGCHVMAVERLSGRLLWKTRIGPAGGNAAYPGPRATPSIDGDLLITMTQHGDVVCLDLGDGRLRWQKSLERDLGGEHPRWHFGESPLVDGDRVICTPGGSGGALAALDKRTGAVLWRSGGITDPAAYASPVIAHGAGQRQYVQLTAEHVFSVAPASGAVLWSVPRQGVRAVVPTPLIAGDEVYVTSGYGCGCNLYRVERRGGGLAVREVYSGKGMVNHHGGVVKRGDHVYGYSDGAGWTCQEFGTGKVTWSDRGIGKGCVTCADGHLYCRSEDGWMALVEATPEGYREKGRFKQPERSSKRAWPHPVIGGGCLYVRDQAVLLCYDVRRGG
ncbi:MAG: PQQ-like beta-propeller repeat protein [Verrucomicrobia bacterium]|nr:PQQ-like beta-propeller repeat protein [Verrucomicrobiota bacterium]